MSAGTRAAAQKASLQQRLAGSGGGGGDDGGDDGGDGTPELETPQAKTSKTTETFEKRPVYAAITNA